VASLAEGDQAAAGCAAQRSVWPASAPSADGLPPQPRFAGWQFVSPGPWSRAGLSNWPSSSSGSERSRRELAALSARAGQHHSSGRWTRWRSDRPADRERPSRLTASPQQRVCSRAASSRAGHRQARPGQSPGDPRRKTTPSRHSDHSAPQDSPSMRERAPFQRQSVSCPLWIVVTWVLLFAAWPAWAGLPLDRPIDLVLDESLPPLPTAQPAPDQGLRKMTQCVVTAKR